MPYTKAGLDALESALVSRRPALHVYDLGDGMLVPVDMVHDLFDTESPLEKQKKILYWLSLFQSIPLLGQEKWKSDYIIHPDDHSFLAEEVKKVKHELQVHQGILVDPKDYPIIVTP